MERFRLSPRLQDQAIFTAEIIVEMFLETCNHWFIMQENQLFGMKNECRSALLLFVKSGVRIDDYGPIGYVLGKFESEWLGDHKCVFLKEEQHEK
jgi:hypothetical protein